MTKTMGVVGMLCALSASLGPAAWGAMRSPVTLYVATDGNDTWSGRQPKRGQGQAGQPLLRAARPDGPSGKETNLK